MVTYANAHFVFRIIGHFGPNATTKREAWSTGFRLASTGSDVSVGADLESFLPAAASSIQTFHTSSAALVGSNCWLGELTIARVGVDGKYLPAAQETTRYVYPSVLAGVAQPVHAWNSALVISLRTSWPRGIASNGRTYWPATGIPIDSSTGRISGSQVANFAGAAATMITAINGAAHTHLGASVNVSVVGATGVTGPARSAAVESIRVDERLDSIERRENDQPTIFHEVAVL